MDILLVRLAGSRRPGVDELRTALDRQRWLVPEPQRYGVGSRAFAFPGGLAQLRTKPWGDGSGYEAPGLLVSMGSESSFRWLAPRLVSLAGELRLGIDVSGSRGALWWEAPQPSNLDPALLQRAVTASCACRGCHAWPLFGFALAGPECLELAESHAALAVLVACASRVAGRYRRDIPADEWPAFLRQLACRRRREILAALDFPATESMVRLLGKIPAERLDLESLRLLRDLRLPSRATQALRHLSRFGSTLVPIVVRRRLWPHVGAQLLREAAEDPEDGFVLSQLRDAVDMAEALGRLNEIGVVPSAAVLNQLHDRLRHDYETRAQRSLQEHRCRNEVKRTRSARQRVAVHASTPPRRVHPEPPPPPPGLVPLRTALELREEGREMKHCVGSLSRRVERGDMLVYRVLQPERATLALCWNKKRAGWSIDELRGFENQPVREETRMLVRDWLETGCVDPAGAHAAREAARRRFREVMKRAQQATGPIERQRLREELARTWVGRRPV